jgi:hypothetical protein
MLSEARNAVAHGDEFDIQLAVARKDRHGLIETARQLVADAMVAAPAIELSRELFLAAEPQT